MPRLRRSRVTAHMLLVGLVVLMLAPEAAVVSAVWTHRSVRVLDYTTPQWEGLVESMVAEFNAMLPASAPRLVYRRKPVRACQDLKARRHVGAIIVCSRPKAPYMGLTDVRDDEAGFYEARVSLSDREFLTVENAANTLCHELMHAVTGIDDNYDQRPETSCVWGGLATPGDFDVTYAHRVYPTEN